MAYSNLPSKKTSIHEDALEIKAYSGFIIMMAQVGVLVPAKGSSSR